MCSSRNPLKVKDELQNLSIKINNQTVTNSEWIKIILDFKKKLLFQCNTLLFFIHQFCKE